MARRTVYKKIHYVRAIYNPGTHPGVDFAELVRRALLKKPLMGETVSEISTLGVMLVRHRHSQWQDANKPLKLALGAGMPGEAMSTFGTQPDIDSDIDVPAIPPEDRAFKQADAFILIEQNDVLICTDGIMRSYHSVASYLRVLFSLTNLPTEALAFDFEPASNQDKRKTLEKEGVKALHLKGTMFSATHELEEHAGNGVMHLLRQFKQMVQQHFTENARNEAERDMLAHHWSDINVVTSISPRGASRADPIILHTLDATANTMVDEVPDDINVVIETRYGNTIKSGDVILTKRIRVQLKEEQNDLDVFEIWPELDRFRDELIQRGAWLR